MILKNNQYFKKPFKIKPFFAAFNCSRSSSDVNDKSFTDKRRKFIDFRRIRIIGGKGGNGCLSFLSLFANEYAGPDGGDGGNGGHVIFEANSRVSSLEHINHIYRAGDGKNGKGKNCDGKSAAHIQVKVPLGTLFKDLNQEILSDLRTEGQLFVAARGGAGGKGNRFFLSNEERAPVTHELGAEGEEKVVFAELRILAHSGLVGFPNAGKSTLLRAISRARPKVAAYPFTTLNPMIGMVEYPDFQQIAVADIPGLIKDAHLNYGLGFSFLRHIERCICLLYVLDLAQDEPWKQFEQLQFELEQYQTGLSKKPFAIVANKIDLPIGQKNLDHLKECTNLPIFPISAKQKTNIDELLTHLRSLYDKHIADSISD